MAEDLNNSDEPIISEGQLAVALAELHVEGLIEFENNDGFKFTEKGLDYAFNLHSSLPHKDVIVLELLFETLKAIAGREASD